MPRRSYLKYKSFKEMYQDVQELKLTPHDLQFRPDGTLVVRPFNPEMVSKEHSGPQKNCLNSASSVKSDPPLNSQNLDEMNKAQSLEEQFKLLEEQRLSDSITYEAKIKLLEELLRQKEHEQQASFGELDALHQFQNDELGKLLREREVERTGKLQALERNENLAKRVSVLSEEKRSLQSQLQKQINSLTAEVTAFTMQSISIDADRAESQRTISSLQTEITRLRQSYSDKLKCLEAKLLEHQTNETNAREMIDILNAANANLQRQIQESLHMQAEDIRAFNTEKPRTEDIGSQTQLASPNDSPTQEQERQLMPVEDMDPEPQMVILLDPVSQTDSTPGIEGSHEEEEQNVRQEHEAQMQNSPTVSREIESDEDQHANQQQTTHQQTTLSTPHWGSDSNSSSGPMPAEVEDKNICPSGIEFDDDHRFTGVLELPVNCACAMCESGIYEARSSYSCMHCDFLVCYDCYDKYENDYYLRHPEYLKQPCIS